MSDPNDTGAPAAQLISGGSVALGNTTNLALEVKPAKTETEPHWLSDRLDQARRAQLKELGAENVDDVKAALADLKAKREAEKTVAEKAADALSRAATAEQSASTLREAVSSFAARQMETLTEEQRAAVDVIAGNDPAQQLKAIAALMPTWAKANIEETKAAVSSDTAPPANAPQPLTTSPTNHKSQYETLRKSNPFAAAAYALAHESEIYGT